ncbi:uncharacterized protein KGF55_004783 [Candida pseudojiufengensis]|uniref:uncharacterized protein n=1 Tax=Candida pseudojiufengensis TaxID=497109 RepID=UPI002225380F|nr:uncharacterized protein KGF55_004783 [Candida pseudojiufengensis]KAI5960060.1 hypothetical protein KGF55_004783 [Candida pseudojiufengensis]
MNFDFLSQTIPEQSPNINHQNSFSSNIQNSNDEELNQLISPNPNNLDNLQSTNSLSTFDFQDYLHSANSTMDNIDLKLDESFPPLPPYLQTPKASASPTFLNQQPLGGSNFSNQSTPAIKSNGHFTTILQNNNESQHNINKIFSPINTTYSNNIPENNNNDNSINTPNSVLGLNNSSQQFTPPNTNNNISQISSTRTSIAENPSPTIGLGLNTNQPLTQFEQMINQQSLLTTPTQQRFYNHNQNSNKTSPFAQYQLASPNQIQDIHQEQSQSQQLPFNLNTHKAQSESNLHLQKLWQQHIENSFQFEDSIESLNQISVENINTGIKQESKILKLDLKPSDEQQSINDSPTTIEIASPQSSDNETSDNNGYNYSHNITAEELLNDDFFEDLNQNNSLNKFDNSINNDSKSEQIRIENDSNTIKIEPQSPKMPPIFKNEPSKTISQKLTSTTIIPRRKKNSISGPVSSNSSKSNKKVLKKSSSFNGTSALFNNSKLQWTKNQTTTTSTSTSSISPTTTTFKNSKSLSSSSSTTKKPVSGNNSHIDLINSMPVITLKNHYSFIYENVDTIYQQDSELNSKKPTETNSSINSTNLSSTIPSNNQIKKQSTSKNKNLKSGLIEFQIDLKN